MAKNPTPLRTLKKDNETGCFEGAPEVKKLDCAFYNSCLDRAIEQKWPNFGCTRCHAYELLDTEQRVQDVLGLLAAREAAKNVIRMGKAGRTRGVKPGVDAKVRKRKVS